MAFEFNDLIGILFVVLATTPLTSTTNFNCNDKPFYCVNSTHFMICVDLGNGLSSTIDDFVIPCPPTTECRPTNRFECEFPNFHEPPRPLHVIGVTANEVSESTPLSDSATTKVLIAETTMLPVEEQHLPPLEEKTSPKLTEILENLKEEFTDGSEKKFEESPMLPNSTMKPDSEVSYINTTHNDTNKIGPVSNHTMQVLEGNFSQVIDTTETKLGSVDAYDSNKNITALPPTIDTEQSFDIDLNIPSNNESITTSGVSASEKGLSTTPINNVESITVTDYPQMVETFTDETNVLTTEASYGQPDGNTVVDNDTSEKSKNLKSTQKETSIENVPTTLNRTENVNGIFNLTVSQEQAKEYNLSRNKSLTDDFFNVAEASILTWTDSPRTEIPVNSTEKANLDITEALSTIIPVTMTMENSTNIVGNNNETLFFNDIQFSTDEPIAHHSTNNILKTVTEQIINGTTGFHETLYSTTASDTTKDIYEENGDIFKMLYWQENEADAVNTTIISTVQTIEITSTTPTSYENNTADVLNTTQNIPGDNIFTTYSIDDATQSSSDLLKNENLSKELNSTVAILNKFFGATPSLVLTNYTTAIPPVFKANASQYELNITSDHVNTSVHKDVETVYRNMLLTEQTKTTTTTNLDTSVITSIPQGMIDVNENNFEAQGDFTTDGIEIIAPVLTIREQSINILEPQQTEQSIITTTESIDTNVIKQNTSNTSETDKQVNNNVADVESSNVAFTKAENVSLISIVTKPPVTIANDVKEVEAYGINSFAYTTESSTVNAIDTENTLSSSVPTGKQQPVEDMELGFASTLGPRKINIIDKVNTTLKNPPATPQTTVLYDNSITTEGNMKNVTMTNENDERGSIYFTLTPLTNLTSDNKLDEEISLGTDNYPTEQTTRHQDVFFTTVQPINDPSILKLTEFESRSKVNETTRLTTENHLSVGISTDKALSVNNTHTLPSSNNTHDAYTEDAIATRGNIGSEEAIITTLQNNISFANYEENISGFDNNVTTASNIGKVNSSSGVNIEIWHEPFKSLHYTPVSPKGTEAAMEQQADISSSIIQVMIATTKKPNIPLESSIGTEAAMEQQTDIPSRIMPVMIATTEEPNLPLATSVGTEAAMKQQTHIPSTTIPVMVTTTDEPSISLASSKSTEAAKEHQTDIPSRIIPVMVTTTDEPNIPLATSIGTEAAMKQQTHIPSTTIPVMVTTTDEPNISLASSKSTEAAKEHQTDMPSRIIPVMVTTMDEPNISLASSKSTEAAMEHQTDIPSRIIPVIVATTEKPNIPLSSSKSTASAMEYQTDIPSRFIPVMVATTEKPNIPPAYSIGTEAALEQQTTSRIIPVRVATTEEPNIPSTYSKGTEAAIEKQTDISSRIIPVMVASAEKPNIPSTYSKGTEAAMEQQTDISSRIIPVMVATAEKPNIPSTYSKGTEAAMEQQTDISSRVIPVMVATTEKPNIPSTYSKGTEAVMEQQTDISSRIIPVMVATTEKPNIPSTYSKGTEAAMEQQTDISTRMIPVVVATTEKPNIPSIFSKGTEAVMEQQTDISSRIIPVMVATTEKPNIPSTYSKGTEAAMEQQTDISSRMIPVMVATTEKPNIPSTYSKGTEAAMEQQTDISTRMIPVVVATTEKPNIPSIFSKGTEAVMKQQTDISSRIIPVMVATTEKPNIPSTYSTDTEAVMERQLNISSRIIPVKVANTEEPNILQASPKETRATLIQGTNKVIQGTGKVSRITPITVVTTNNPIHSNSNNLTTLIFFKSNVNISDNIDIQVKNTNSSDSMFTNFTSKPAEPTSKTVTISILDMFLKDTILTNDVIDLRNQLQNMSHINTTLHKEALQSYNTTSNSKTATNLNREDVNLENGNSTLTETQMNIEMGFDNQFKDHSIEDNETGTDFEVTSAPTSASYGSVKIPANDIEQQDYVVSSSNATFNPAYTENQSNMSKDASESKITTSKNFSHFSSMNNTTSVLIVDKGHSGNNNGYGISKSNNKVSNLRVFNNITEQPNITNYAMEPSNLKSQNVNLKKPNVLINARNVTTNLTSNKNLTGEAAVKITAPLFDCWNNTRGKYADSKDCRKFYICLGKLEPIVGTCPNNTVFSEINKQCTRNLSHCVRNNQFHCLYEGRFSDFLKDNIYYICVKQNLHFLRYKLQCQMGYHLNKVTVKCEEDLESSSQSGSSVSENSQMNEQGGKDLPETIEKLYKDGKDDFECKKEGKFASVDCTKYYVCSKNKKNEFRRKIKKCSDDEVFNKKNKKCVPAESNEC